MKNARVPGVSGGSLYTRLIFFLGKRALGQVPAPWRIAALAKKIFSAQIGMERAQLGAKTVPAGLKSLALGRAGSLVGCPF